MHVHVIDHPLAADALARLRDARTPRDGFRKALRDLSRHLVYEACRTLPTEKVEFDTPMGPTTGERIGEDKELPLVVPVLRAGLGMLEAALEMLPGAHTGFVGLRRNEETLLPDSYLDTVPPALDGQPVMVLDPMLATAGSAVYACELLRKAGAGTITVVCVLSAPEGIATLADSGHADIHYTAAIDSHLNDIGYIVPGLGDAGDRQYGAQ